MKVKIAKTAGFCMGVRRAMEMVLAEANKGEGPIFTFGPLIHNNQVLDLLATKGVSPVEDIQELHDGRIVIRAHGIPPQKRQAIKRTRLKIVDATCPKVARVQALIRYHSKKGYTAIIVGDKDHAEIRGLIGYSKTPAHVIQRVEQVAALPQHEKLFVVAQTTQNQKNYRIVVKALKERFPEILVFDTICDATHQRQQEVKSFSGQVDAVVIVGGYHSGNTQRLCEVSKDAGMPTFHVETEKDQDDDSRYNMPGPQALIAHRRPPNATRRSPAHRRRRESPPGPSSRRLKDAEREEKYGKGRWARWAYRHRFRAPPRPVECRLGRERQRPRRPDTHR